MGQIVQRKNQPIRNHAKPVEQRGASCATSGSPVMSYRPRRPAWQIRRRRARLSTEKSSENDPASVRRGRDARKIVQLAFDLAVLHAGRNRVALGADDILTDFVQSGRSSGRSDVRDRASHLRGIRKLRSLLTFSCRHEWV